MTYQENRCYHGMTKTRVYRIWRNMKQRCSNPNNTEYERYGGRGIAVCEHQTIGARLKRGLSHAACLAMMLLCTTVGAEDLKPGEIPADDEKIPTGEGFVGVAPSYLTLLKVESAHSGSWVGSGAFISERLILTCHHNVRGLKNGKDIKVQLPDGTMFYNVSIEKTDKRYDLALLKVNDPFVWRHSTIAVQDTYVMTPKVLAVGFDPTVPGFCAYQGVFTGRTYGEKGVKGPVYRSHTGKLIQGMSGGPLVDSMGRLIGVNVATSKSTGSLSTRVELIWKFLDDYDGPFDWEE